MAKRDKKRKQGWEPAAKRGNGPPTTSSSSSSKRTQHPDSERTKHKPTTKQQQHQQAPHKQKQHQDPTIPFDVHDRILLVGEGDLSFARSVVEHHGCADVLATTLDPVAELLEKYPQAAAHIQYLEDEGQGVMHEVDATKLAQKELRKGQLWDRVVFNFPHVGGRSKDVNRQVRYNQGMFLGDDRVWMCGFFGGVNSCSRGLIVFDVQKCWLSFSRLQRVCWRLMGLLSSPSSKANLIRSGISVTWAGIATWNCREVSSSKQAHTLDTHTLGHWAISKVGVDGREKTGYREAIFSRPEDHFRHNHTKLETGRERETTTTRREMRIEIIIWDQAT